MISEKKNELITAKHSTDKLGIFLSGTIRPTFVIYGLLKHWSFLQVRFVYTYVSREVFCLQEKMHEQTLEEYISIINKYINLEVYFLLK